MNGGQYADNGGEETGSSGRPTRRSFLAAGSAVALAGLAGCAALDDIVGQATDRAVGTTSASPAGFYTVPAAAVPGGREGAYASGPVDVRYLPATVRIDAGEFELEGWSTSSSTKAQDYNSSRSNRPRTVWWDDDDDGDGIGTLVAALDTERALAVYLDSASEAVDGLSKADSKRALDGFITTTTGALRDEGLATCPTDSCGTVRETLERCREFVEAASAAVDREEWDQASKSLSEAGRLLDSDTKRLLGDLDSDGDGLLDGTESLYTYLDGDPVIGERFAVCLPDARLEDGPSVGADLTPRRVMEYFVGERDADGCLDTGRSLVVHRDLACRSLLSATLDEENDKGRAVRAMPTEDGVVVTGTVPRLPGAAPMVFVSGNEVTVPDSLESWGAERAVGEARVTPTLVCPATALPPECPAPLPALFYLQRVRHDEQYIYTGGWLLDDGALYTDSASLLVAEVSGAVAGVTTEEIERNGSITIEGLGGRRKRPGRARYGDITLKKGYARDAEYLPAGAQPVCPAESAGYWAVQSQEAYAHGGGDCDDSDTDIRPTALVTALDAPLLHLVEASEASNEVKFKAGAELSKSVN